MSHRDCVVVVGGTRGIGLEIVKHYAGQGYEVVLSGRRGDETREIALGIEGHVKGIELDLARPHAIRGNLSEVGPVRYLILVAIERDQNSIADYDIDRAINLTTLKLVGYSEVVHCLRSRLTEDAALVLFGGQAKDIPYPGSTTVSTVNGGILGLTRSLVHELAPIRVNSIHPGIVGDSPYWAPRQAALEATKARTPTHRLTRMEDVVDACAFLLRNLAMNGVELHVDGGILAT